VLDTEYFVNETRRLGPQRTTIRREWDLDEMSVVFLFVGKFIENKRPMDFVRAVGEAKLKDARVEGLMVGDGPLRAAIEGSVRQERLPIRFAGFLNQSQIARAYVAADALLLPSNGETWGLVVNEAMACGVPCFVSDKVGCAPDMIKTGETGATFPLGDNKALGQMLAEFAANKERKWMSERAREKAQHYTLDVAVDRTIRAIEAVSR
jgi:glycosyltransferase involved in cell wall biosynthesis